jgi:glycogen(starch) synthase
MVRHIFPTLDLSNGVAVYGQEVEDIIAGLPERLRHQNITHIEIGNGGAAQLWVAHRLRRRPRTHKLVLTLHDPPVVVAKPFAPYFGASLVAKVPRKLLDITIGRLVVRSVVRSADAIIVLNPLALPVVARRFGIPASRIHVLPNINLLGSITKLPKPSRQRRILFFGNLARQKGLDVLIHAYLQAKLDDPNTPLVVAGGWGDNHAYRQQIERLAQSVQNITFTGRIDNQALSRQVAAATVVVLPYYDPGIIHASGPLVIAMSYGKPVIASDIPIFAGYLKDHQTGILFPPGDVAALATQLSDLLGNPVAQRQLGESAKHWAMEHYSIATLAKTLTEVYQSL